MRVVTIIGTVVLAALAITGWADTENKSLIIRSVTGQVDGQESAFSILLAPKEKSVQVTREKGDGTLPPHLRLRIHRRNDRPLDVRLAPIVPPSSEVVGAHYGGVMDQWNQSYVGFELQFSFDKKTWKRIGEKIGRWAK